jgi:hypothetical protein
MYHENMYGVLFKDFSLILKKMKRTDWLRLNNFLQDKKIFMRFHDYYAQRVWYLFFRVAQERYSGYVPERYLLQLRKVLGVKKVSVLNAAVEDISKGKQIDLKKLLESPNFFLFICRVVLSPAGVLLFRNRQPIKLH